MGSHIGEACISGSEIKGREERTEVGKHVRAVIHFDSEYARDFAVRVATPNSNHALAERVASFLEKVRSVRPLDFRHVKGHMGCGQ